LPKARIIIASPPDGLRHGKAMPPFGDGPALSWFEFWPAWLFYAPVWLWIIGLMIRHRSIRAPLLANPGFPMGGLVGERKSELFARLTGPERQHLPNYLAIRRCTGSSPNQWQEVCTQLSKAGLTYPLVAKPDIGCRGAGVQPVRTALDLRRYLHAFPAGETLLLQRMIDVEGEAGVFYVREPGAQRGQILSLTLKYFPRVVGDGHSTLRELILADRRAGKVPQLYFGRFAAELDRVLRPGESKRLVFSGSHSKGAIFRNGNAYITPAMGQRFDAIADAIEGFHFGRFDVRFADFAAFQRGADFSIIEYNGAGAEMTHIWDSRTGLIEAWQALCEQYSALFRIGAKNRHDGARPESWRSIFKQWRREKSLVACYPITN
jgi:hypothetical protein